MNAAYAALAGLLLYFLAYRFYASYLGRKVFGLQPDRPTPAHQFRDDVDYIPTRPSILFGHHFASITGLAPMLGPAVAVIWGWVPAFLWVVLGAILIGCVHDFAALVLSVRARGQSIGKVAEGVVGKRACSLFHVIIFFGVSLAMGVFVYVIARLFSLELQPGFPGYPQAVFPSALLMIVAFIAGILLFKKGFALAPVTAVGFLILLLSIAVSKQYPTIGLPESSWPGPAMWTYTLLGYAFLASVLPVWALLQSRDFLNSLLLYLGLILAFAGIFIGRPEFVAPAIAEHPADAPPIIPFVFIVIACGAASGFHGLVSSGTTAKQLDREHHALPVAYGGMIGESLLGLLAVLACTAGFASSDEWHHLYRDWSSMQSPAIKIDAFIQGATSFIVVLGLPRDLAASLIAMVVVSFALTTLDSATRLLRFNIEEIGQTFRLPFGNRYLSSALACAAIAFFAFYKIGGRPAALALWSLFGTTNQLLAGLTLLTVTVYLLQRKRNPWFTGVPMVFMLISTMIAMLANLGSFTHDWTFASKILENGNSVPLPWPLIAVGGLLLIMGVWLVIESALVIRRTLRDKIYIESIMVFAEDQKNDENPG